MVADLATAEIVLVGEEHRHRETTEYLNRLLDSLDGRQIALLLELREELQPTVDAYVLNGASPEFAAAVHEGAALPLDGILAWALFDYWVNLGDLTRP
ncbi:MAG: hypothetical protein ACYC7A_06005 [Thermoanaerobaculia bacterium]